MGSPLLDFIVIFVIAIIVWFLIALFLTFVIVVIGEWIGEIASKINNKGG